jgi:hypothetical protein
MALEAESADGVSLPDLVSEVVALRPRTAGPRDPASRLADELAYDIALVHLCDRLRVEHALTGDRAGPIARRQSEIEIGRRLPTLGRLNEPADY